MTMEQRSFPISRVFELGRLSQAGADALIEPSVEERSRIASWAGVDAVDAFLAKIELRKLSPTRFSYEADVSADIRQSCVVTLEPVRSHIERHMSRELVLSPSLQRAGSKAPEGEPEPVDEDGREEIDSLRYDLAVPALEELALSIDPYPRAPGVVFEPPVDPLDAAVHPFAALKTLKKRP
jgi:hypothetical protein